MLRRPSSPRFLLCVPALMLLAVSPVLGQVRLSEQPRVQVGALETPPEQVFGQIEDIVFTNARRLIVLDFLEKEVRMFAEDGTLLGRTGREGKGPGEFNWPQSIELLSTDSLLLLDSGNLRLSVYAIEQRGFTLAREMRLPTIFQDLCVLGDKLILTGPWNGHTVHEFSREGQFVRSVGPLPSPSSADPAESRRREALANGSSVCLESRSTVVLLPLIVPTVAVVSLTDGALRQVQIPEYRATQIASTSRGTVTFGPDPKSGTADQAVGFAALGDRTVLVQVQEFGWEGPVEHLRSYLLDVPTGRLVRASESLPAAVRVVGDAFLSKGIDLFPYFAEWTLRDVRP